MKRHLVIVPVAALLVGGALTLPAPATAPASTLRFNAFPDGRAFGGDDAKPRGESPGDTTVFSMRLQKAGKVAGRLEGISTSLDPHYAGALFTVSVLLPNGSLEMQGSGLNDRAPATPRTPRSDTVLAVTGGTGSYAGASGAAVIHATDGARQVLTIELQ